MEFQLAVIGLVFDTNILLSNGKTLEIILRDFTKYNLCIIVPYIVIQELDGLKTNQVPERSFAAREASRWIYKNIEHPFLCLEKASDRFNTTLGLVSNDDMILECCKTYKNRYSEIVLLTNDRIMALKAISNDIIPIVDWDGEIRSLLESVQSNLNKHGSSDYVQDFDGDSIMVDHSSSFTKGAPAVTSNDDFIVTEDVTGDAFTPSSNLDSVLREFEKSLTKSVEASFCKYLGNDWEYVVDRRKPYRTIDILRLIDKHWLSVFSSVLPRYSRKYIIDALNLLKASKGSNPGTANEEKLKELLQNIQFLFGKTSLLYSP